MRFGCPVTLTLLAFGCLPVPNAFASGLLDFETTPTGAVPADDTSLASPYAISGGTVRFFFDANGNNVFDSGIDAQPVFEHIGQDGSNAFLNNIANVPDTARAGFAAQLGTFMLRTPSGGDPGRPFIAAYDTIFPIRELSGEIWDIDGAPADGTEQWRIDVLSTGGSILATGLSPLGTAFDAASLDGLPWTFQFRNLPDGVASIRLTFVGSKTQFGIAFNNFSPDVAVPEPSSLALPLAAAMLLTRRRRPAGATPDAPASPCRPQSVA